MVKGWRDWLPKMLFESALIVFSVLLALGLDEWREEREWNERTALAISAIQSELETNRAAAEEARRFHRATHDTLAALAASRALPAPSLYYEQGMFKSARTLSTAWESARQAGAIARMPYPLTLQLARAYGSQARYEALADQLTAEIYSDIRMRGPDVVLRDGFRGFITLAEDFANRETTLIMQYDRALEALARLN